MMGYVRTYVGFYRRYMVIMEKNMETSISWAAESLVCRGYQSFCGLNTQLLRKGL